MAKKTANTRSSAQSKRRRTLKKLLNASNRKGRRLGYKNEEAMYKALAALKA